MGHHSDGLWQQTAPTRLSLSARYGLNGHQFGTTVKDIAWRASERGTTRKLGKLNLGNEEPSEGSRTKSNERRNEARQGSKVKLNSKELDISRDNIIFFYRNIPILKFYAVSKQSEALFPSLKNSAGSHRKGIPP